MKSQTIMFVFSFTLATQHLGRLVTAQEAIVMACLGSGMCNDAFVKLCKLHNKSGCKTYMASHVPVL